MLVWLIANVGQRDLQVDGCPLDAHRLRDDAARVQREYDALRDRVFAPMLSAALDYLRSAAQSVEVRVLLLTTDQTDPRFRDGDTVICGNVLKRFLTDRYPSLVSKVLIHTTNHPPHLYDRMLEDFRSLLLTRLEPPGERYYLLLAGGTPAANAALLLAGVWLFAEKAHALTVGEDTGRVRPMDIGRRIVASYRRDRVCELLTRRDFAGAAALLDADSPARIVADAAAKRLNFDFSPSAKMLGDLLAQRGGALPPELDPLYADAQRLADHDNPAVMREVYWNAMVKWHREEYADFLGRLWRLIEASLQEAVGRISGINLTDKHASAKAFDAWVQTRSDLLDHLNRETGRPPAQRIEQSAWLLAFILGWLVDHDPAAKSDPFRACHHAVQALAPLRALRNKSVLAHGFQGLSKESILNELPSPQETALLDSLARLLSIWNIDPGSNPYALFAASLEKLLPQA